LIDDLLDLTRITRGKLQLSLERVDGNALVHDAIEIASSAIAAKQLKVDTELNATKPEILGDSIRLQQVFWNLINNAVKFTPPGGQIVIRTSNKERGRFHFEITDSGIGIEPERMASLFIPFEQADPSVTRQFGGLGLGLAISKYLIELHHGTIEAESFGRSFGATFKIALETVPDEIGKGVLPSDAARHHTKPLRILIVEDHNDTRRTLSRLLTHFGHQVSAADNICSALKILGSGPIDVLLCDIGLPDGSGYDVISHAKERRPIKAIAITGFGTEQDVRRCKEAGFDFHLVKPVDLQELQGVLDQVGS